MSHTSAVLKDFKITKLLGSGSYGAVIQASSSLDKKSYAIKISGADDGSATREVRNFLLIPAHPNVVKYVTFWEERVAVQDLLVVMQIRDLRSKFNLPPAVAHIHIFCIQMELCSFDLRAWLEQQSFVSLKDVSKIFLEMTSALDHIHNHNVIHRDLKPENIFLTRENHTISAKIGDLGLAKWHLNGSRDATHTRGMGTTLYLAPEQGTARYGRQADFYAMGLILFEMFNPVLQKTKNAGSYEKLFQAFMELKHYKVIPPLMGKRWPRESQLVLDLLVANPELRAGVREINRVFSFIPIAPLSPPYAATGGGLSGSNRNLALGLGVGVVDREKRVVRTPSLQQLSSPNRNPIRRTLSRGSSINLTSPTPPTPTSSRRFIFGGTSPTPPPARGFTLNNPTPATPPTPTSPRRFNFLSDSNICQKCSQKIQETHVTFKGLSYHKECFVCKKCGAKLGIGPHFERNGDFYCDKDFHSFFSPKCAKCSRPCLSDQYVSANGNCFHNSCFTCTKCRMKLGLKYYEKGGGFYCFSDFHDLFSPRCHKCKRPCTDKYCTTTEGKTFHHHCFLCSGCGSSLTKYFKKDGKYFCHSCSVHWNRHHNNV